MLWHYHAEELMLWHYHAEELMLWHYHAGGVLRVPWRARSNQPILKEMNPEYSLGGLMLKLYYFDHLI